MAVVQCRNKHYYDNVKFKECPHCAKTAEEEMQRRAVLESQRTGTYASEYIRRSMLEQQITEKAAQEEAASKEAEKNAGEAGRLEPAPYAAGWLVCVGGAEYGMSFPLYAGFNRIGREDESDIILTDQQVSIGEHCSVIYEERKNVFYIAPKAGNLVYADDALVEQAREIENGTVIMAGETELELVVFCKGEKRWEKSRQKRG